MVARNDITGDSIQTKSASSAFRDNYDRIFRKDKNMERREENNKKCGCGRSPSGYCMGWHSLTEEQYQEKLARHIQLTEKVNNKNEESND